MEKEGSRGYNKPWYGMHEVEEGSKYPCLESSSSYPMCVANNSGNYQVLAPQRDLKIDIQKGKKKKSHIKPQGYFQDLNTTFH